MSRSLRQWAHLAIALGVILPLVYTGVTAVTAAPLSVQGDPSGATTVSSMGHGHDGRVVHYDSDGREQWRIDGALSYNDVAPGPNGTVVITRQHTREECPPTDPPCARTDVQLVDPDTGTVHWQYGIDTPTIMNAEIHDAEYLPHRDEIVFVDMVAERVVAVDRQSKSVTWQWNASSHYTPPDDPDARDWLHINDVDYIGDGRYLVSVRNANQLVIIERGAGVVDVINTDTTPENDGQCRGLTGNELVGDDPQCGPASVLDHQHNPQWLDDGAVLVADSENDRVVELHRQPNGSWTIAWQLHGAGGIPFDWPRDADRLPNGNTLITDTRNDRVLEVTRQGEIVWSIRTPGEPYDAERNGTEYPAGPRYENASATGHSRIEQPIAVINTAYGALDWKFGLPYWIRAWHLAILFAGLVLSLTGILVELTTRLSHRLSTIPADDAPAD